MMMRCAVLSLFAGAVTLVAVELGMRGSWQPELTAAGAAIVVAALVQLGLRRWVAWPPHDGGAAQEAQAARLREAEQGLARLAALEAGTASLRHDLRGILSPALLTADRLLGSEDRLVKRAGEAMVRAVERAEARLAETRDDAPPG